jgi:AraC-like DNA-binding protein
MNPNIKQIGTRLELAHEAKYSAAAMAKICGVSVRTLHRHFMKSTGKNSRTWLLEQRQHYAVKLLSEGSPVKEVAARLGYKQQTNFTRQFKFKTGASPSMKIPPLNPNKTQPSVND